MNATGLRAFWWFGAMFVYLLMPTVDLLLGTDAANPPEAALAWLEQDRYYRWCIYAFLPLQYASFAWACWLWSRGGMSGVDKLGLMVTMGMVSGIGINTAHELGHKKEHYERWFAKIALAPVAYGHFFIEHNRGHHVRVATPEDPASSKLGPVVLALPAAHRHRQPALRLGAGSAPVAAAGAVNLQHQQRHHQRLADDAGPVRRCWSAGSG